MSCCCHQSISLPHQPRHQVHFLWDVQNSPSHIRRKKTLGIKHQTCGTENPILKKKTKDSTNNLIRSETWFLLSYHPKQRASSLTLVLLFINSFSCFSQLSKDSSPISLDASVSTLGLSQKGTFYNSFNSLHVQNDFTSRHHSKKTSPS